MVSIINYFFTVLRNTRGRFLGFIVSNYLRLLGCKVGKNLRCPVFPHFRETPNKNIFIGNNVSLGYNLIIEITPKGKLHFGNNVLIGDNCTISSAAEISMGDFSAIAENVSIRGSFHELGISQPYLLQNYTAKNITIGRDCGIGAGTVVLLGANIPDGVFIGSASLVLEKSSMHPNGIYAGNPLKFIRNRE